MIRAPRLGDGQWIAILDGDREPDRAHALVRSLAAQLPNDRLLLVASEVRPGIPAGVLAPSLGLRMVYVRSRLVLAPFATPDDASMLAAMSAAHRVPTIVPDDVPAQSAWVLSLPSDSTWERAVDALAGGTWPPSEPPITRPLRRAPSVTPEAHVAPPPRDPDDPRPRVLLLADTREWAFDVNNRAMADSLPQFKCSFGYVEDLGTRDWADPRRFDAVFAPYHRWCLDELLPWDRMLGSLRSAYFLPERGAPPSDADVAMVNRHRAFHVVTRAAFDALSPRCPGVVYLTNPVDTRRFSRPFPTSRPLVASWSGNAKHANNVTDDIKGFHAVVKPACASAGVALVAAEYSTSRIPHVEMPAFYARGTVTLCASRYEGASNSVMEAMAMGHAVIATDVGNHREMAESQMRHLGDRGIELVARDPNAFAAALRRLRDDPERVARMGALNAAEIASRWSWNAWKDRYAAFVRKALV